jgi:hypothetical protein
MYGTRWNIKTPEGFIVDRVAMKKVSESCRRDLHSSADELLLILLECEAPGACKSLQISLQ